MSRDPDRAPPRWLMGSFVIATGAVVVLSVAAYRHVPAPLVWGAAASMLALGVIGCRNSRGMSAASAVETALLRGQLAEASGRIEGLTRSQGRFVGNIAHEIKTPLSIVLNQSELLASCADGDPVVRQHAKSIGEEIRHLSALVESFLRLARPFAQEDTSEHVPVGFHDVVVEAVQRSQSVARKGEVRIVATLAERGSDDVADEVLGDPVLLEAMVENLLRNAVRLSPVGSRVEVLVEFDAGSVVLFVRDRGVGIAPENAVSVFDWFFDVATHQRRSTGTGFGLAIAKRIAEHHQGTIALHNREEGGCEFEIRLPRWLGDSTHGQAPSAAATSSVSFATNGEVAARSSAL